MSTLTYRPARPIDVALKQGRMPLPAGAQILGVITRGAGDDGLLIRTRGGRLAQLNAGVIRTLDQRAAEQAMTCSR